MPRLATNVQLGRMICSRLNLVSVGPEVAGRLVDVEVARPVVLAVAGAAGTAPARRWCRSGSSARTGGGSLSITVTTPAGSTARPRGSWNTASSVVGGMPEPIVWAYVQPVAVRAQRSTRQPHRSATQTSPEPSVAGATRAAACRACPAGRRSRRCRTCRRTCRRAGTPARGCSGRRRRRAAPRRARGRCRSPRRTACGTGRRRSRWTRT